MKINYEAIQDYFPANSQAIAKGDGRFFCPSCKKTMDEKQFFKTSRTDRFPSGILPHCKTCVTMLVDDTDQSTFLPILKEIDIPYMPTEWRALVAKKEARSASILGKYASKMKLNQFKKYTWADTSFLVENESKSLLDALRQEYETEAEAEDQLDLILSMSDMEKVKPPSAGGASPENLTAMYGLSPETSKYDLTQEEINSLKRTWGEEYSEDQYLVLEQMFEDMKAAYIIQDPIAVSNARMICKMTVKMNKFLDIDDVESAAKISRQLDTFIKTSALSPAQLKDRQQSTYAICQLAFILEKEGGFLPEYTIEKPLDKIDEMLADMKEYTEYLIRGIPNVEEMVSNTEAILARDALPEAEKDDDDFATLERELLAEIEYIEGGDEDASSD